MVIITEGELIPLPLRGDSLQIADSERAGRLAVERGVAAQTRQLCVSGSGPDPRLSGSSDRGLVRRKPRGATRCCKIRGVVAGYGRSLIAERMRRGRRRGGAILAGQCRSPGQASMRSATSPGPVRTVYRA